MNLILIAVISLGAIALVITAILYVFPRNLPCNENQCCRCAFPMARQCLYSGILPRYPKCCLRLTAVDVVIRVAADLLMLASKPVRWKVSFVR